MSTIIRPLGHQDHEKWIGLFAGYQNFYRAKIPDNIVEHTWRRIHDPDSKVHGLGAEVDGKLIGFTHYLFHDSTWSDRPTCYLEDLFVDSTARGSDAAKGLIKAVEEAARDNNAFRVYWHTQQYNGRARSLYDTITPPSSFIVYRIGL
ncbi:MAG: GNAT family N-acetyltransferase [Pseudomonadota bacterium]